MQWWSILLWTCTHDESDCDKCNKLVSQLGGNIIISNIGDGICDKSIWKVKQCKYDGGNCNDNTVSVGVDESEGMRV